jgi:hypothetical protein
VIEEERLAEAILDHAEALRANTGVLEEIKEILAEQCQMIREMMPSEARGEDIPVRVTKSPELSVLPGIDRPDDSA